MGCGPWLDPLLLRLTLLRTEQWHGTPLPLLQPQQESKAHIQTQGTEVQGQLEEPDDVTLIPALNMVRAVVVLTRALVM